MLQVRNVSKWYGDVLVLKGVSFNLNHGDRAGLIGPNGAGKSTLLRILTGEIPDAGSIQLAPGTRVGYLRQALEFSPEATVGSLLLSDLEAAEARLEALADAIARSAGDALAQVLAEYDDALARLQTSGARQAEAQAVLAGLGLPDIQTGTYVSVLSGGEKTRLALASVLLQHPHLLLLDEPTNHLDIEALEWLESYLAAYSGAVLIVSHDRAFLDRTVNRILELNDETHELRAYAGNYSAYGEQVDRELDKQWSAYREQQDRISGLKASIGKLTGDALGIEKETIDFYYRKIAKGLARRAVVQKRRLERMLEQEDVLEKPGLQWRMKLELAEPQRSGRDALQVSGLNVAFGEKQVLRGLDLYLEYGERVAITGANGTGKTTLLRCIAGQLAPHSGEIRLGQGVRVGYMAQEQELLNAEATPLMLIRDAAAMDETEARSFLHYFLFAGDEVHIPVGRLSYGERSRLMLALLAARGCNLLLLDEPTNHLDIPSRESFERAIAGYPGTLIAVVHDRYFVERLATKQFALLGGRLRQI